MNQPIVKCSNKGQLKECQGYCCLLCLGATDCDWACELNPRDCGYANTEEKEEC